MAKQQRKNEYKNDEVKMEKPKRRFFASSGRPLSFNEPKLTFEFQDMSNEYVLDLHIYKYVNLVEKNVFLGNELLISIQSSHVLTVCRYLDTSLIDVDVQPNYVRATLKGKVFQLALNDEIRTSDAKSQRSLTTGHLLIKMPKLCASNENEKATDISNKSGK